MTAPAWLIRARGDNTRAAHLRLCPRCHGAVLVGLDADVAAGLATVDPAPLNSLGEAHALLNGGRTYSVRTVGKRKEIDYRYAHNIDDGTAGKHVVAEHQCEYTPPREHIQFPEQKPLRRIEEYGNGPPF